MCFTVLRGLFTKISSQNLFLATLSELLSHFFTFLVISFIDTLVKLFLNLIFDLHLLDSITETSLKMKK
jgi:hypothetical protein